MSPSILALYSCEAIHYSLVCMCGIYNAACIAIAASQLAYTYAMAYSSPFIKDYSIERKNLDFRLYLKILLND